MFFLFSLDWVTFVHHISWAIVGLAHCCFVYQFKMNLQLSFETHFLSVYPNSIFCQVPTDEKAHSLMLTPPRAAGTFTVFLRFVWAALELCRTYCLEFWLRSSVLCFLTVPSI